jgi:hypothetical protein
MTVYVEHNNGRYAWIVRVGRGRGSVIKSRHRLKRKAKQRARTIARKRNDSVRVQTKQTGQWKTLASYG